MICCIALLFINTEFSITILYLSVVQSCNVHQVKVESVLSNLFFC